MPAAVREEYQRQQAKLSTLYAFWFGAKCDLYCPKLSVFLNSLRKTDRGCGCFDGFRFWLWVIWKQGKLYCLFGKCLVKKMLSVKVVEGGKYSELSPWERLPRLTTWNWLIQALHVCTEQAASISKLAFDLSSFFSFFFFSLETHSSLFLFSSRL